MFELTILLDPTDNIHLSSLETWQLQFVQSTFRLKSKLSRHPKSQYTSILDFTTFHLKDKKKCDNSICLLLYLKVYLLKIISKCRV